uniref:Uncharacterized protein n=1 Tax=viral metagenome TaxID=1070528 RepID=A0A6M3IIM5_9ZZZZ
MSILEEIKVEASLPVQSRVDTKVLASLLRYWEGEGHYIKTMSQLLSWSMDLLFEILSQNNRLNTIYGSFAEADDYLIDRGLYQPGIGKKGRRKASSARRFESMRIRGIDPKSTDPSAFNAVHNKQGVNVSNMGDTVNVPEHTTEERHTRDEIEFLKIMEDRERKKKMNEDADARYAEQKASGAIKYDENGLIIQESRSDTSVEQVNKWRKDDSLYESEIDDKPRVKPTMVKTKVSRKDELARPLTSEELERKEVEREKKDRDQLEAFKNM